MAEPLKTFFDRALVERIAARLARAGLDPAGFVDRAADGLADLELMDRARHVAAAMRPVLPADGEAALDALIRSFGPRHGSDQLLGNGMAPFEYLPDAALIAEIGVDWPDAGLRACEEVTKRFTAEFCVRPIFERHPERTWAAIDRWIADADPHVRRLASEGLRPRLPWAPRLRSLLADPRPAIARLDRLVDDPAELVRRSVANHLGDIAKDHPDLAVETARRWLSRPTDARRRLVRHGLRHLVKQGHAGALAALGFADADVAVERFVVPAEVVLGDPVPYGFELVGRGDGPQDLVVDVVVGFVKRRGQRSPKVFKLAKLTLAPGERVTLRGTVRTHAMTTRSHFPGLHTIEVQVNGRRYPGGAFEARDAGFR